MSTAAMKTTATTTGQRHTMPLETLGSPKTDRI